MKNTGYDIHLKYQSAFSFFTFILRKDMKQRFLLYAICMLLLSCTNKPSDTTSKPQDSTTTKIDSIPTSTYPELTRERFLELVDNIPEHCQTKTPETTWTKEYYKAWFDAREIPIGVVGEIGNDEFLYYFVCGNGDCGTHEIKMGNMSVKGDTAYVKFTIKHGDEKPEPHKFKLVIKDNQWIMADYDNTLTELKNYFVDQRKYLRSKEYTDYVESILNDPEQEEYKDAYRKELKKVEEYFKKRPE